MPHRRFLALIVMTGVSGLCGLDARADEPPPYEVYAVRYGTAPGCPVSFLVQGAEKERKVDLAFTFWVLKGPGGRTVLVDAGFYRPQFFKEFEGDNVYLYENLDKHVPITATLDAKSNLAAQDRMKQLAANPRLIIPGHDPEVFVRFPKPGNGVARIE